MAAINRLQKTATPFLKKKDNPGKSPLPSARRIHLPENLIIPEPTFLTGIPLIHLSAEQSKIMHISGPVKNKLMTDAEIWVSDIVSRWEGTLFTGSGFAGYIHESRMLEKPEALPWFRDPKYDIKLDFGHLLGYFGGVTGDFMRDYPGILLGCAADKDYIEAAPRFGIPKSFVRKLLSISTIIEVGESLIRAHHNNKHIISNGLE